MRSILSSILEAIRSYVTQHEAADAESVRRAAQMDRAFDQERKDRSYVRTLNREKAGYPFSLWRFGP